MKVTVPSNRRGIVCFIDDKILLIMKLTAALLLVLCLQVRATGYAQKVSFTGRHVPLGKVLKVIQEQTGYYFFLDDDLLGSAGKVNVELKNADISAAMMQCLAGSNFDYRVIDKTILIYERVLKSPQELRVTGTVLSSVGGLPLIGASVKVKGLPPGLSRRERCLFHQRTG